MADMIRTVLVEQKMMYEERIAQLTSERDESRREICETLSALDGSDNGLSSPAMIAQERGWEYLYPNEELSNEDNNA